MSKCPPVQAFIPAVLLFVSLGYPITSFAALVVKATTGDKQVTLQWAKVKNANNYSVCYATQTITDINNCLNYTGGTWQDITKTTLKIGNLINGKKYYFRVLAKNSIITLGFSKTISAIPQAYALNDTGLTTCSDGVSNNLPCPANGYPNQDAQSGSDTTQNDNGNGHAGFDFTKISSASKALTANSTSWSCIKDNVTGLMWEVKTDDNGLHDKNWRYSWYEPYDTKNGGYAGYQNGSTCGTPGACNTDAYVKAVNTAGWCGYKDWRIPSKAELLSIVDYSQLNIMIDTSYFPDIVSDWFWSSSPYANDVNSAWVVNFNTNGNDYSTYKNHDYAVRLVRGGQ